MSISTWPPELLEIYEWLPLKSLIAAQGVNRQWRHLVPLADILPARRALLDLYIDFVASPVFLPTRPMILENLRPFDREAYIAIFHNAGLSLPVEFLVWLLEWPNKAVIGCYWPGLPNDLFITPHKNTGRTRKTSLERLIHRGWKPTSISILHPMWLR